ncbi:MAG: asparagine synthase-related protein [Anaerolineae bacterium]
MSLNGNQQKAASFDRSALALDAAAEVERIVAWLREAVHRQLRRQGAVVGISGGVDSSVALALCASAFGPERVVALMLPERDSSPDSAALAQRVADRYSVAPLLEEISAALDGFGCYERRDEAVRRIFPQFEAGLEDQDHPAGQSAGAGHAQRLSPDCDQPRRPRVEPAHAAA